MNFLLVICSYLTYKRFLLFWAFAGMVITHSWLTEPWNLEVWHSVARIALYSCGALAVFSFAASVVVNKFDVDFKLSMYEIGMMLYLAMAIVSSLINTYTIEPYPIIQLTVPIVFGLSISSLFTEKDVNKVIIAITIFGLLNLILTFIIFVYEFLDMLALFPISGFITDRNGFAKFLALINCFILIEFILQKNKLKKLLLGLLIGLIFIGILILFSRSGYIVYFISTSVILLMSNSKKIKRVAFILMPILLVLFSVFTLNRMQAEKMLVVNSSDIGRVYVGKAGINMIKAHPIRGIGYRMSEVQIPKYADRKLPGLSELVTIHNWYICVWAEMGIFGFLLFLGLNVSLIFSCYKRVRTIGFEKGKYALFSLGALIIFIFDAQVLPNYDYESIYWIIVAVSVICLKKSETRAVSLKPA